MLSLVSDNIVYMINVGRSEIIRISLKKMFSSFIMTVDLTTLI